MASIIQPIQESRRDSSLDVLRGFALAGVLFMFCVSDIGSPDGYTNSLVDEIIAWPKWILVENRMYTMLILIFGIGFHVQLEKARSCRAPLVPVYTRRLLGLLIIGVLHAIFLSARDILVFYALAGTLLLIVRNATSRQLFIFTGVVFLLLVTPVTQMLAGNPWRKAGVLIQPNNYTDHVQYNWQYFKVYHQLYSVYLDMLFHFLLGFWISRSGLWNRLKNDLVLRRRLLVLSFAGALLFIPLHYFYIDPVVSGKVYGMTGSWVKFLAVTGLKLLWQAWMLISVTLYGILLIGLTRSAQGQRTLQPLAAFGRMALSNYLIQSLVLVPYFLMFDKYRNLPPSSGFILFLVVFVLQLLFSSWWMKRFKLGPFEWLLRSMTYWRWQVIRRAESAA
jgi:uncharacterized protein